MAETGLKNPIIKTTMTIGNKTSQTVSFSSMAIMGQNTMFEANMKSYSSLDALAEDGFQAGDLQYDAFSAAAAIPNHPSEMKLGRLQVDAVAFRILEGQFPTGKLFTMYGADYDEDLSTITYTTVETVETANGGTTGIAGACDLKFAGATGDEEIFKDGYTFEYSGDTTPAADGTYTCLGDATEGAGTVTVTIAEALPAAI